ncbi:MAG: hypothetical protein IAF02_03960 [Anaerolineae bacterium]|nr:hypothetical protein [Anaerolineae bacterium]
MKRKVIFLFVLILILSLLVLSPISAQGTWTTGIDVQNTANSAGTVSIIFYDSAGNNAGSVSDSITAYGSLSVYVPSIPNNELAPGDYAAVVSADVPVAATTSLQNYDLGGADMYLGTAAPENILTFPLVYRNHTSGKWNSQLIVQNTSDVNPLSVTLKLYTTGSSTPNETDTVSIPAKASYNFNISDAKYDQFGPFGSATVEASAPLAGVAMSIRNPGTGAKNVIETSYRAFGSAQQGKEIVLPLVYKNYNTWTSGINIVNTGSVSTTVTVEYTNANPNLPNIGSNPGPWQDEIEIPANAMGSFYTPSNATGLPDGFYGSASIVSDDQDILVVVASQRYPTSGAQGVAYEGSLDDASITACVSAPVVHNRTSWKTGINILNMGAQTATVKIDYISSAAGISNATQTISIGAGQPASIYMPSDATTALGFYGAADLKSTNGQPLLVNIANTRADRGVSSNYVGINYTCPSP